MSVEIRSTVRDGGRYDIVVCGGGVAGVAAAVSAARLGRKVLLIEKSMMLGGLATLGLINYFVPMCNGRGKQIIFGMAEELLRLSMRYGYGDVHEDFVDGRISEEKLAAYAAAGQNPPRYTLRYGADIFALTMTELCRDCGVELLFDSIVTDAQADASDPCRISGITVENKSGRTRYAAAQFVDATGDADLLWRIGAPTTVRGNFHSYFAFGISLDSCRRAVEAGDIALAGHGFSGGHSSLYGGGHPENIPLYDGTDAADVNRYLVDNQLELLENIKGHDRKSRDITTLPRMAQFRTTRCLVGDYTLQESDVYRHFDDSVGAICDFDRRDYLFEIPYGTMVRKGFDNVITAGRSASAEGYAWDVLRVIPPAIITGQAAGIACSLAVDADCPIGDVDIAALQAELARENVLIHFDDADVPAESSGEIEHND